MVWIVAINKYGRAGHRHSSQNRADFFRSTVFAFGYELNAGAGHRPFQFVAVKIAGKLIVLLSEFELEIERRPIEIGGDEPAARQRAFRLLRQSGVISANEHAEEKSKKSFAHSEDLELGW